LLAFLGVGVQMTALICDLPNRLYRPKKYLVLAVVSFVAAVIVAWLLRRAGYAVARSG
jgi:hypothetical protein